MVRASWKLSGQSNCQEEHRHRYLQKLETARLRFLGCHALDRIDQNELILTSSKTHEAYVVAYCVEGRGEPDDDEPGLQDRTIRDARTTYENAVVEYVEGMDTQTIHLI